MQIHVKVQFTAMNQCQDGIYSTEMTIGQMEMSGSDYLMSHDGSNNMMRSNMKSYLHNINMLNMFETCL